MKNFARRVAKGLYRRVPLTVRVSFERIISPVTRKLFLAGLSWAPPPTIGWRPISIVIPSYNDIELLRPLLRSIEKTVENRNYEVIISDDFCQLENSKLLKGLESTHVRVVTGENRTGFAGAVNRGLMHAKWDVVLLNSDMKALPGWLDWLEYCAYEIDPQVGMVSPHLIYPTGRIQYGGTYQNRVAAPQWFSHLFQGKPANFKPAQERRYIRANCGAAIYVKKQTLDAIGYLDDQFWLGFEDVDWSYKAWAAGFRCMIEPSSRLIHLESATRGFSQGPREYGSMRRFWSKWKAAPTLSSKKTRLVIVHSQPGDLAMTLLAETIATTLEKQLGMEVSIHVIPSGVVIDEKLVSQFKSTPYRLLALDKGSLASVWLACIGRTTPIAFFDDFGLAQINPANSNDIALLPPEFDYAVTNKANHSILAAQIPWEISILSHPVSAPKLELHARQLTEILVVEADEGFADNLRDALQMELVVNEISMSSFLRQLRKCDAGQLAGKVVIFGCQLNSSTFALSAMSQGAIIFHQKSEHVALDLLDGYNSFIYTPNHLPKIVAQISYLVESENALSELVRNGASTSHKHGNTFAQKLDWLLGNPMRVQLPEVNE